MEKCMFSDSWEENPLEVTSLIKGAFSFRKGVDWRNSGAGH